MYLLPLKFPGGGYKQILILIAVLVAILGASFVRGLENLRLYAFYFAFGNVIFRIKYSGLIKAKQEQWLGAICATMFVIMITGYFLSGYSAMRWGLFKLMGVAGSISFASFAVLVVKLKAGNFILEWMGKNSLAIYAIHWCLLFSLDIPSLWRVAELLPFYFVAIAGWFIWTLICCILIHLFKNNIITRKLLLGE